MARIYGGRKDGIREIVLTFDDGPSSKNTPKILDLLSQHGIAAVFFVVGEKLETQTGRAIVARAKREGHTIGNHSYSHPNLRTLAKDKIVDQITRTHDLIQECAQARCRLFRPPYGAINTLVGEVLHEFGYTQILWTVDTMDWKYKEDEKWVDYGMEQIKTREDSIVLMHDIHSTTVKNLDSFISRIKKIRNTRFAVL
jgi:peptidoglycan/xylan/chitin deacetylase (PgdA/CDA1 family)